VFSLLALAFSVDEKHPQGGEGLLDCRMQRARQAGMVQGQQLGTPISPQQSSLQTTFQ